MDTAVVMERGPYSKAGGFTLVELVMVLILIGIISSLSIGLFAGRSAFSPLLAAQQLSSATLLAQQAALAGNEAGSMTVSENATAFQFTIGSGTGSERAFEIPREGTALAVTAAGAGGILPFTVQFDNQGTPVASTNTLFTFTGESRYDVCLSSLGAVYAGACSP